MKYPKLVRHPETPVKVVIGSETPNEYGERSVLLDASFLCNYQDAAAVQHTTDKQKTTITGTVYIDGDICPDAVVISCGHVVIFGERRDIAKGCKARNFDGSVNYTRLDVI